MKYTLFLTALALTSLAKAQNEVDYRNLLSETYVTENSLFEVIADEPSYWAFQIVSPQWCESEMRISTVGMTTAFEINLSSDRFCWANARRFQEIGDKDVYFKGIIYRYNDVHEVLDSAIVRMNYLPSLPQLLTCTYDYTYDNKHVGEGYDVMGKRLYGTFESKRASAYWFYHESTTDDRYAHTLVACQADEEGITAFDCPFWTVPCTRHILGVWNAYGEVLGNSIYTNNYIVEDEVRQAVLQDSIRQVALGVKSVEQTNTLKWHLYGRCLVLEPTLEGRGRVCLYRMDGTLQRQYVAAERIDLTDLQGGLYMMVYVCDNRRTLMGKVLLH